MICVNTNRQVDDVTKRRRRADLSEGDAGDPDHGRGARPLTRGDCTKDKAASKL
jgi:hypothetical protein